MALVDTDYYKLLNMVLHTDYNSQDNYNFRALELKILIPSFHKDLHYCLLNKKKPALQKQTKQKHYLWVANFLTSCLGNIKLMRGNLSGTNKLGNIKQQSISIS